MPRRIEYKNDTYEGFAINACAEMPIYLGALKRVFAVIRTCEGRRWEVVHLVLWLRDERSSISPVLRRLQRSFAVGCFRYVWAKEDAPDHDAAAPKRHFHMAAFYDAQSHSFSTLTGSLAALVQDEFLINYKVIRPDKSKISNKELLLKLNDVESPKYGLDMRNDSHVVWAFFWFSYLAKINTKENAIGRVFGSTKIY